MNRAPDRMSSELQGLKPTRRLHVYDLVREAGINVADWANSKRPDRPAQNPKYCFEWAFEGHDRVALCLWFDVMREDEAGIFQELNFRELISSGQCTAGAHVRRARTMDRIIREAFLRGLPVRVLVVDGIHRTKPGDTARQHAECRRLDPMPWHVASYDDRSGRCILRRGVGPAGAGTFTVEEVEAAESFAEGSVATSTSTTRERSARLRALARDHFARESNDGRLRCAACGWAPPPDLELSGPIIEIHHAIDLRSYPTAGRTLSRDEALRHLHPLCPNCHRITHAKTGGGLFTVEELRSTYGTA